MEVVQGQMVVLQAWYSPSADISKNSVIWYFSGNASKQVRREQPKQCNVVLNSCSDLWCKDNREPL